MSYLDFRFKIYIFCNVIFLPDISFQTIEFKPGELFMFSFFFLLVSPESIVIPILSCILGFPLLALLVICCLRRRAKLARERDRRRNYDLQDHAVGLVRISNIHRLSE